LTQNISFIDHMTSVGFSNALTNTFIFGEEEGDSHDPLTQFVEKRTDDIETIVSTTDRYKQKGKVSNEKGSQSPIVSQKSGPPKNNFQSKHHNRESLQQIIQVMEVTKTLCRENWKNHTNFK
jgi:hypothetical protein